VTAPPPRIERIEAIERIETIVVGRRDAADGVVELTLAAADGAPLPAWKPGAHIDLHVAEAPAGAPDEAPSPSLTRQYSLCGDPADRDTWRIAVLREPTGRGGSARLHDEIGDGARLSVSGPRNNFELLPAARYVFIAGGIGVTPLLPMIAQAEADGAEWSLLYGGRTRRSMAFAHELASAHGPKVAVRPQDEYGLLDLNTLLREYGTDTLIYACGPGPMLDAVANASKHWPPGSLRIERFTPIDAGAPARSESFEVVLARSGLALTVEPGQSILETADKAGVNVLFSCREGTCGTCETNVLEGTPEHRDSLLTEEERAGNETMFICVSRSLGPRLVLDL
jgi:ferredoxin-NADP reductase